jgi:hypothetical protein
MCLICIEYEKGKLLATEGLRNLEEMKPQLEEKHYIEVYDKLYDDQIEQQLEEYWEQWGFGD